MLFLVSRYIAVRIDFCRKALEANNCVHTIPTAHIWLQCCISYLKVTDCKERLILNKKHAKTFLCSLYVDGYWYTRLYFNTPVFIKAVCTIMHILFFYILLTNNGFRTMEKYTPSILFALVLYFVNIT